MDIIYGKLDMIIKLLEDVVDNTQPIEIRDVIIQNQTLPRSPSTSLGENGSIGDEREEINFENSILNIGQRHRFIEQEDDRGILHLYIQYWDIREEEWKNIHKF